MPKLAVPEPVLESPATSYPYSSLRDAILPQQLFMRILCLERKRSERSNRRFVLMLLESPTLLRTDQSPDSRQDNSIVVAIDKGYGHHRMVPKWINPRRAVHRDKC